MYIFTKQHIYLSFWHQDIVMLDTKKDIYGLFTGNEANIIKNAIKNNTPSLLTSLPQNVQELFCYYKERPYRYNLFFHSQQAKGASNIDWRLTPGYDPSDYETIIWNNKLLYKCIRTLAYVQFKIKTKGLYSLINKIKRLSSETLIIPTSDKIISLSKHIDRACLIYPFKAECLIWSLTFALIGLKENWDCSINIGVQNNPFAAHAWVQVGGKIVTDNANLNEVMSTILQEPLR